MFTTLARAVTTTINNPNDLQGASGTSIFDGIITDKDDHQEWSSQQNIVKNVNQMRRGDPRCKQATGLRKCPILGAKIRIEPASEDNIDVKIAKFVEANLFGENDLYPTYQPQFNFQDVLRQQLLYLDFGHSVMEYSRERRDGKVWIKDIQYRSPKTLFKWNNDNGQLISVEQQAVYGDDAMKKVTPMLAENLIVSTNDMEGLDFEGQSLLRPAYSYWKAKSDLVRIELRKFWAFSGIPEVEVKGKNLNSEGQEAIENMVSKIYANEQAWLQKNDSWALSIFGMGAGGQGTGLSAIEFMKWCDHQIIFSVNGNFMTKGEEGVGSYALAEIGADIFYKDVEADANYVETTWNRSRGNISVIPRLVKENFGDNVKVPKIKLEKLEFSNLTDFSRRLNMYLKSGALSPYRALSEWIVEKEELPELPDEEDMKANIKKIGNGLPPNVDTEEAKNQIYAQDMEGRGKLVTPEIIEFESRVVDFPKIENKLDVVRNDIGKQVSEYRNQMIKSLVDSGTYVLGKAKGDPVKLKKLLSDTFVPFTGNLAKAVNEIAQDVFDFGRATVYEEIQKQVDIGNEARIIEDLKGARKSIKVGVESKVNGFADLLKSEWNDEIIDQFESGQINTTQLTDSLNRISEAKFNRALSETSTKAFGLGRNQQIFRYKDKVKRIVRSEKMDTRVCAPCSRVDGLTMSGIDDPRFTAFANGVYSGCEGGSLCRGINIVDAMLTSDFKPREVGRPRRYRLA